VLLTNPAPTSEFEIGDHVAHPKFGDGVVKAIDGDKLTIQFKGHVIKQIVDYYMKHRR
jgi:DNA helicase-2/ATP-dependent DNA helicase PcrA